MRSFPSRLRCRTGISFTLIVTLVGYFIRKDIIKLDGISGEIWGLLTESNTKYSPDYSHHKFGQIKIGMTEKQVIEIIGEPIIRWQPYQYTNFREKIHYIGLQYSESPTGTNYRLRQVYLNNGKVAEIISYYYLY
jgi:hypothetical protein